MKIIISVLSPVLLVVSALVFAHGDATGVVKERMELMGNLNGAMKALIPIFQGQKDYEIEQVKQYALVIRDNARELTKLFPAGSLKESSEATLGIWPEREAFKRIANRLERFGQALHDSAENNQTAGSWGGTGGFGMMGGPWGGMNGHWGGMNGHWGGMNGHWGGMNGHWGGMTGPWGSTGGPWGGIDNISDEQLATMPAVGLFRMIGQTCASCHMQYRVE